MLYPYFQLGLAETMKDAASVEVLNTEVLSDNWYTLRKVTYRIRRSNGEWETQSREAYDRGNGATILLYDRDRGTVILTKQFRLPTYVNGNASGMLIEACAGLLDQDDPEACIAREAKEETGFEIRNARKIFEAYMSPGSVTEVLHFFVADYSRQERVDEGGGCRADRVRKGHDRAAVQDRGPRAELGAHHHLGLHPGLARCRELQPQNLGEGQLDVVQELKLVHDRFLYWTSSGPCRCGAGRDTRG